MQGYPTATRRHFECRAQSADLVPYNRSKIPLKRPLTDRERRLNAWIYTPFKWRILMDRLPSIVFTTPIFAWGRAIGPVRRLDP